MIRHKSGGEERGTEAEMSGKKQATITHSTVGGTISLSIERYNELSYSPDGATAIRVLK